MWQETTVKRSWTLASLALSDAYTDFMLSRQAMECSAATLEFYRHTAGAFLKWIEAQGVTSPAEVTARWVRAYLAQLKGGDTSKNAHARAIKTLVRFWHAEKYMSELVTFAMPRIAKKRLPVLSAEQVGQVFSVCDLRGRTIVLLMVDSGLRRSEVCALNWDDVDISSGLVRVNRGKGGKARSAAIGVTTRRALLAYRRSSSRADNLKRHSVFDDGSAPLFLARRGARLTGDGLMLVFRRISKRVGFLVTCHSLRRTFVILSLRAGMGPLHIQAMLGYASLAMTMHYAEMVDDDLLDAHRAHSPIDNLPRLKWATAYKMRRIPFWR